MAKVILLTLTTSEMYSRFALNSLFRNLKILQLKRSFAAIINKCLSGKTTALESHRLSLENKNSKKNNEMYYPRFTKVIVDYFMEKDKAIPRRNKMFWHFSRDDFMFTTIRVISKHQDIKKADSDTSPKKKHVQAPKVKRLKATVKVPKSRKKKLSAQGLHTLSEISLSEAEQIKIATKRSKIQLYSSYASGSGVDEGIGVSPWDPDVPTYDSNDEQISWKSSDDEDDDDADDQCDDDDQDDDNKQTESDNDGDDFLHPKLSTFDEEERHDEK
nr:hypothetical protein [Tanacetum cinerariifolium]